jgi:hypothetical protein
LPAKARDKPYAFSPPFAVIASSRQPHNGCAVARLSESKPRPNEIHLRVACQQAWPRISLNTRVIFAADPLVRVSSILWPIAGLIDT